VTARHDGPAAPAPRAPDRPATQYDQASTGERVALVDLLDRVLAGGVVIAGDVTLSIADVDLVTVSLRALVTSVSTLVSAQSDLEEHNR
jgi:Gas vesicle protein